jgi:AcrR family transcriptional regulator
MARPKKALISRRKTLEGLEALSIRRLGHEMNVQGISLYHHFKDKKEILVGAAALALANVRTPKTDQSDWREWLFQNTLEYRKALCAHPNLIPVLMQRHPLRIGLAEHNSTAGLLSVLGVPKGAIMPLLEGLEELALGSASYRSAADADEHSESWSREYPSLYHLSRSRALSHDRLFEIITRGTIDAIMREFEKGKPSKAAH